MSNVWCGWGGGLVQRLLLVCCWPVYKNRPTAPVVPFLCFVDGCDGASTTGEATFFFDSSSSCNLISVHHQHWISIAHYTFHSSVKRPKCLVFLVLYFFAFYNIITLKQRASTFTLRSKQLQKEKEKEKEMRSVVRTNQLHSRASQWINYITRAAFSGKKVDSATKMTRLLDGEDSGMKSPRTKQDLMNKTKFAADSKVSATKNNIIKFEFQWMNHLTYLYLLAFLIFST